MTAKTTAVGSDQKIGFNSFLQIGRGQLWLRQFFATSRKAELNQLLKSQDTLALKRTIFASGFALFNLGLLTLFAVRRLSHHKIVIPPLLVGFTAGVYQIGVVWLNRQFLRAIENTDSEQAYYLRRELLRQLRQKDEIAFVRTVVGPRISLLAKMNQQYQKIYGMEDNV